MLALEQLLARRLKAEPLGAIDLREALTAAAFRRPFDFEAVAVDRGAIDIPLAGIDDEPLGFRHHRFAEQAQGAVEGDPKLLREFAPRRCLRILPLVDQALGDRPRTV